jgi:dihydroxyacetone kinase
MLVAQHGLDKMVFEKGNALWLMINVLGNARILDLIGTWRTTQENMRNHSVTWL